MALARGSIVLALLLAVTGTASAGWKEYATAHKWDSSDVDGNGALDCPAGSYNGSPAVFTNKPHGGWFELHFSHHPNPGLDLSSPFVEITRRCPRTFNEYAENHYHGVRNVRLATWLNKVYAVYDTYSGYHGGDRIKLQLNPELITAAVGPPYTLLHLWRNPRGYVDVDHHSPEWVGHEDCTTLGLPPAVIDQDWRAHWGASHTGTLCHPPALTETADPDIAIAPANPDESAHGEFRTLASAGLGDEGDVFIVWIERYVDGKFGLGPGPTGEARWMYGFDPNYYLPPGRDPSVPGPNFPYDDTFKVHVDMVKTSELTESHVFGGNHGHASPARTPLTGSDGLANPLVDAYSPRVTTYFDPVIGGGGNRVLVAFAEGTGSSDNDYFIKARKWDSGKQWSLAGNTVGWKTCNWRTVSSGRASGRKELVVTATHDLATMNWHGVESPVLVLLRGEGGRCDLVVYVYGPADDTWVQLGSNLAKNPVDGEPEAPRVAVYSDVPFITWAERDRTTGRRHVYVRRYNRETGKWDLLGDRWDPPPTGGLEPDDDAYNPAIAIGEMAGPGAPADVYVSFLEQNPRSSVHPQDPRVSFVNVYRCTTDLFGSTHDCVDPPAPELGGAPQGYLGVASAEVAWSNNGAGALEAAAHLLGFNQVLHQDGATDLVVGARTLTGHPLSMWVGWPGEVQSHRNFDQGLYVREGNPERSQAAQSLAAAILPLSRSVQVGSPATALATIINTGNNTALSVSISLQTNIPASFTYQTTDPQTNALTGSPNTPVNIPAHGSQSFLIAITPTALMLPTDVAFNFTGTNTSPAPTVLGLNTLLLSGSINPVPDVIALSSTLGNDGVVKISNIVGTGAFAVASSNVGASASITVSADTGNATLPVVLSLCQTNPQNGQCISAVGPTVTIQINAGDTPTFSVFVSANALIPFDPANNRIFVRFKDGQGITRGSTSVAVQTE